MEAMELQVKETEAEIILEEAILAHTLLVAVEELALLQKIILIQEERLQVLEEMD